MNLNTFISGLPGTLVSSRKDEQMPNTQVATQDPHVDVQQEQTMGERERAYDPNATLDARRDSDPAVAELLDLFARVKNAPVAKHTAAPNPSFDAVEARLTAESPITDRWHPGMYANRGESEAA